MLSDSDRYQIQQKGISPEQVQAQIESFKTGFPYQKVVRPAIQRDGITIFDSKESEKLVSLFDQNTSGNKIVKFVPASGAATRMFKVLFEQLEKQKNENLEPEAAEIIDMLDYFAFYDDLKQVINLRGSNLSTILDQGDYHQILKYIIDEHGLNYGNLPKGLLKFHQYTNDNRTALEEHLVEGALYAKNADGKVFIHFTVSPEHLNGFNQKVKQVKSTYEKELGVSFNISYSVQKPSTDTLAVGADNEPFRNNDGSILFRPGGHGALIENLNEIEGDIIYIKNIDNVVPDKLKSDTVYWKKVLLGSLVMIQKQVFDYLKKLELSMDHNDSLYSEIALFIESKLGYRFSKQFGSLPDDVQKNQLFNILNRPIRICGMVRNTGEPGGGPFWIENKDGSQSLQILEASEFDLTNNIQKAIFKSSTHFNPVDLVISTHDYKGKKFDLTKFRNPETGFISKKSKDGKELKALELPGLWNGAMAFWNTLFVEVPVITFNPVKTVNDLLRPEHQNSKVKIVKE